MYVDDVCNYYCSHHEWPVERGQLSAGSVWTASTVSDRNGLCGVDPVGMISMADCDKVEEVQ